MHRSILVAALLTILLTATPALAQTPSLAPGYAPIGGVTEDGFVRAASDVYLQCSPTWPPALVQQYAATCAEAGFPILDARPSGASVSAGTPPKPATQASSAGGSTSGGGGSVAPTLPDTGGPLPLLIAGLLLAGVVGLVARRSLR